MFHANDRPTPSVELEPADCGFCLPGILHRSSGILQYASSSSFPHSSPLSLVLSDTRSAFGLMSAVTSKSPAAESDFLERRNRDTESARKDTENASGMSPPDERSSELGPGEMFPFTFVLYKWKINSQF